MSQYKVAKEAFVADNPGSSIASINAVSGVALVSYALCALLSNRARHRVVTDYITTILPLLVSVTIASTRPYLFNGLLLLICGAIYLTTSSREAVDGPNGSQASKNQRQSKGQWLEESDSDEEPIQLPSNPTFNLNRPARPPSRVLSSSSSISVPGSPYTDALSPKPDESGPSKRTWRRRHSPTPSTHTHTAIDILPTPELAIDTSTSTNVKSYPSPLTPRTSKVKGRLPFLSIYRAHMMIMTIHCILAVDFTVFPRWQGKCEDFGTSLMDVGVGSFVFSLGIVSVRSLGHVGTTNIFVLVVQALRKSTSVLALGVVRVIMVKGTEYPEHVTEYGVHWNFFFTLGLLPVFGTLLAPAREKWLQRSVMGLLVTSIHQLCLSYTPLQAWVLSLDRIGFIGQNKEGLVSLPGYLAIYLLGLATGQLILRSIEPLPHAATDGEMQARHADKRRIELALELFSYSVAWWVALSICFLVGGQVSRRLANLPYILWTSAYNTTFLLGYLLVQIFLSPSPPVPPLLEAINVNGLAVFLLANLLTGLVNLSMQTMYIGAGTAMLVLLAYSAIVCVASWIARGFRLNI